MILPLKWTIYSIYELAQSTLISDQVTVSPATQYDSIDLLNRKHDKIRRPFTRLWAHELSNVRARQTVWKKRSLVLPL